MVFPDFKVESVLAQSYFNFFNRTSIFERLTMKRLRYYRPVGCAYTFYSFNKIEEISAFVGKLLFDARGRREPCVAQRSPAQNATRKKFCQKSRKGKT